MPSRLPDLDEILRLDRAHVIHPINEFRKHERQGARSLVENAREVGAHLLGRLRETFGGSPIVGEIRGLGMLAALEIVRDQRTKEPFPNIEDPHRIVAAAFERGLIARALFQCVALSPPLCSTKADVDRMVEILAEVWPAAEREALAAAG